MPFGQEYPSEREREPQHIVALSGGKDSTAMAYRLKELNKHTWYQYVITPTGDELPEMNAHWQRLELELGKLQRLGSETLIELINRQQMIPNFRSRFCTRILKVEPFIKFMESLPVGSVMYVGLRADEHERLGIIDSTINVDYPMQRWGWDIKDVTLYLAEKNIVVPKRTDCGCCFNQRLPEWKALLEHHPDKYEEYVQIEKKFGHTFRSPGRDTWPADLDGLRKEILSGRKMRNFGPRGIKKCRLCTM